MASSSSSPVVVVPKLKMFLRGKQGVEALWGPAPSTFEMETDGAFSSISADLCQYSKDGKLMATVSQEIGFTIRDAASGKVKVEKNHPGIQVMAFSPKGTYLLTWERLQKTTDGSAPAGNLIIWNTASGEIISRYSQKTHSKSTWPSVQWSADEMVCARMVTNEVHFYNGRDIAGGGIISKVRQEGVAAFSLSPEAPYNVAVFVAERKARPASVKLYEFPNTESPKASKSFYKAQEVSMEWSPKGTAVIIQTSTDVDTSGKSYYGETGLYFIQADGNFDCAIPTTKEGPVQDVKWDPTGKGGFIVLAGTMPCHATLYDNKACPVFEFGAASRNVISWSPHGRFVALAGFGNLAGDIDFWDRNKLTKMGSCNANSATTHCWTPDSRFFATATTFPRLRVDNGFKIFRYNGQGPVATGARAELYEMSFLPSEPDVYPNLPQSPKSENSSNGGFSNSTAPVVETKPQAYRPPRGTGRLAAMMKREDTGSKKLDKFAFAPRAGSGSAKASMVKPRIPGMAPEVPKGPSKNALKKKKKEEAIAKAAALKATQEALGLASASVPPPAPVELTAEEKAKKVKGLNKKLKQIAQLKEKMAKEGRGALNEDQLAKIESESSIQKEIASYQ